MHLYGIYMVEPCTVTDTVSVGGLEIVGLGQIRHKPIEDLVDTIHRCSYNSLVFRSKEYEELREKFKLKVGTEFFSPKDKFHDALEDMIFGRTITDVDKDIVIPCLINRQTPDHRGVDYRFIRSWWMSEKRVYRNPENEWDLIATEYYAHLNTMLPDGIRITQLDSSDPRIDGRIKGQCGYFHLQHPKGDCYGALHGAKNVLDLFEFRP